MNENLVIGTVWSLEYHFEFTLNLQRLLVIKLSTISIEYCQRCQVSVSIALGQYLKTHWCSNFIYFTSNVVSSKRIPCDSSSASVGSYSAGVNGASTPRRSIYDKKRERSEKSNTTHVKKYSTFPLRMRRVMMAAGRATVRAMAVSPLGTPYSTMVASVRSVCVAYLTSIE